MSSFTFTEPTTALRDMVRALNVTGVEARVYAGGFPRTVTSPAVAITRLAGNVDELDDALYQFDCWATTAPAAAAAAGALVTALVAEGPQVLDTSSGLAFAGVGAITVTNLTDPDAADSFRTIVTAQVAFRTHPTP